MSAKTTISCSLTNYKSSATGNCPLVGNVFTIKKKKGYIVPLGIPNFKGDIQEEKIEFIIELNEVLDKIVIEIEDVNGAIIFTEDITDPAYLSIGKHSWYWDGFDKNEILDTSVLKGSKFIVRATAHFNKVESIETVDLEFKKKIEKKWIDIKINKRTKHIDVILRVKLKDGGAKMGDTSKIPPNEIIPGKSPITSRTKSFNELVNLVKNGIDTIWGQPIQISGITYSVKVNSLKTTNNSIKSISLVYNTNRSYLGSSNPGTIEGPTSFVGNSITPNRISYNVGYIIFGNGWGYEYKADADPYFKATSAHEIGHTIVKAFSNTVLSYTHNGASDIYQRSNGSVIYPTSGDIDVMQWGYTATTNRGDEARVKARETDVKGMLWLSKIKYK